CRSITSNTASPNWAPCRYGSSRWKTKRRRWRTINAGSPWAGRAASANCSRAPDSSSTCAKRLSGPWWKKSKKNGKLRWERIMDMVDAKHGDVDGAAGLEAAREAALARYAADSRGHLDDLIRLTRIPGVSFDGFDPAEVERS